MSDQLQDYRDRTWAYVEANPQAFLGTLAWFSISGGTEHALGARHSVAVRIKPDELQAHFFALGLDDRYLPAPIKKVDAFRRASSGIKFAYRLQEQRANVQSAEDEQVGELECVEVDYNPEYVLRHIMRRVRNPKTEVITYAHIATLRFYRGARGPAGQRSASQHYKATINDELVEYGLKGKPTGVRIPLTSADRAAAEAAIAEFQARYDDLSEYLHSDALRTMLREYITGLLNSVQVRPSGGVYFTPGSRLEEMRKLQELLHRIGKGCSLHLVPLLREDDQVEMLTDAFGAEMEQEAGRLYKLAEDAITAAKTNNKPISGNKYADLRSQASALLDRSKEYTDVLNIQQARAGAVIDVALEKIYEMVGHLGGQATA